MHNEITNQPFVSVLMLTYNRANLLKEAIESILLQTYRHFELVIIDDGSRDETASVLAEFNDPRIRLVLHKENKGLLQRRKESLSLVRGTHVAVCDSDDLWLPEKLAKQIAYMHEYPACVLVGTWITRIDEAGHEVGMTRYATDDHAIRTRILWRNQFAHSSVLMRRDALEQTEGYRFPFDEDLDLFLQIGRHGSFANIAQPLTKYRVHSGGKSADRLGMIENVLKIIRLHRHQYPSYLPAHLKYSLTHFVLSLSC